MAALPTNRRLASREFGHHTGGDVLAEEAHDLGVRGSDRNGINHGSPQ
jgi:hypothetical protein